MIGIGAELLDSAARKKMMSTDQVFAKKLQSVLREQGHYVEVVNGESVALLDTVSMLKAAIPDPDIALKLMREVHDYNTALFSSANLLTRSQKWMQQAQKLGTKMLDQLSDSFSAKKPQHSKSSKKTTT